MKSLRRWLLEPSMPFSLPLAADARLSATDYLDDQVWEMRLGWAGFPALTLQTRYGGRVGLLSVVPLWQHEGRTVYETQAYAQPPTITGFAPGYLRVEAAITLQLKLQAEYWVIDSHTVGCCFTLSNTHAQATTIQLDLFGHIGAQGKDLPVRILESGALYFGEIGRMNPVVLLEGGMTGAGSPKLSRSLEIGGRKKAQVRWIHSGLATVGASVEQARRWLGQDWKPHLRRVEQAAQAIPDMKTGDEGLDLVIASAYQQLVAGFLRSTAHLPHASLVGLRRPNTGYSLHHDGTHPWREWNGQPPDNVYLAALAIAPVDGALAQGLIRNYLAVQQPDGAIDWKPGLGGQRQGMLCLPVLARLAWGIFQYTEDETFLKETFPGLLKFFRRWLQEDADGDGFPEWQSEYQTGYPFFPAFALSQPWGAHLDIRYAETPSLLAFLLSEAVSLHAIAYYLHDQPRIDELAAVIGQLQHSLDQLWGGEHYVYRDRDTHLRPERIDILKDGRGDELHPLELALEPANRVIVEVEGGVNHSPRLVMTLEGTDAQGAPLTEKADTAAFSWQQSRGVYTTQAVFSHLKQVRFEGLSRVYRVALHTPDWSRLDINALLPLWSVGLNGDHVAKLVSLATDAGHFWRANGVTMCSAQDERFDPANAAGSGAVWPFWLTLIGEGFIETGHAPLAADLLHRLLPVMQRVLSEQHEFSEFYHSEEPVGLGEKGHVSGIVPLHLLMRVLGLRVIHSRKVWVGPFAWDRPVSLEQHGVKVERDTNRTRVYFPSGHQVELQAHTEWVEVTDPEQTTSRLSSRSRKAKN